MPALSPGSMLDPRLSLSRALLFLVLGAPLFAGCGAVAPADASPRGGSAGDIKPKAEPESAFMRVGEVRAAGVTTAEALPPPPPDATLALLKDDDKKAEAHHFAAEPAGAASASATPMAKVSIPKAGGKSAPGGGGHLESAVVESEGSLSEAEVRATIVQRQSSFRECYDIGEKAVASGFSGSVAVRVVIGPSGAVSSVEVVTSTTKNPRVDSCVADAVRKIQFPARGGTAVVGFPIEFGK